MSVSHWKTTFDPLPMWRCAVVLSLIGAALVAVPNLPVLAQTPQQAESPIATPFDRHVAKAAQRFGLRTELILAVIAVESAGDSRAVSHAGAMGLMQIMPATWADLRRRYRLGADPFDPRDNIFAGTAYLREMYDRFGSPGFLAAYNAGPGRYAEHLSTGRPLPRETRAYVAKLAELLGETVTRQDGTAARDPVNWRTSPLFIGHGNAGLEVDIGESPTRPNRADRDEPQPLPDDISDRAADLFVSHDAEGPAP
jgi:hypothetical protein